MSELEYKPRYKSWGDVYFSALGRGYDHGYAAYLADQWEERLKKRTSSVTRPNRGGDNG